MAAQAVLGGTVAAALVGTGVSWGADAVASRQSGPTGTRETAMAVAKEFARTGASTTELLVVVATLLLLTGVLLVGLARRHNVNIRERLTLPLRTRSGGGVPRTA